MKRFLHVGSSFIRQGQNRARIEQKLFPFRRKPDGSVLAIEQRGSQLRFQVANLFADRGLRDMQKLRRPSKPSVFRHRGEVSQVS